MIPDIPVSLTDLQSEMNNVFQRLWHSGLSTKPFDGQEWAPAVDLVEEPDRFVIMAEVPGLDAGDIDLSYTGSELTIKGVKADADRAKEVPATAVRRERRFGQFSRRINIPGAIIPDQISASCRNGVLEINLAKKEDTRSRSIKIEMTE